MQSFTNGTTPGASVLDRGQKSLSELASTINLCIQQAEARARKAVEYALEAGQLLNEAKSQVAHGQWNDWLIANCTVAPRTAQAYMRLARQVPALTDANAQRVADLPLRQAMTAIATDPTPPRRDPEIPMIVNREERNRVVEQFQGTAKKIREASKWFSYGMPVKGPKVASLRQKLLDAIAELDRLQQDGGGE